MALESATLLTVAGYNLYRAQQCATLSGLALMNLEALSSEAPTSSFESSTVIIQWTRQWYESGFLRHKKSFYDCCAIIKKDYNPYDNCKPY